MLPVDNDMIHEGVEMLDEARTREDAETALMGIFDGMGMRPQTFREAGMFGFDPGVIIYNQAGMEFRLSVHESPWNR